MKYPYILLLLLASILPYRLAAQIKWQFSSQKIKDSLFEVHLTARMETGWHIYSQSQPPESIADPVSIEFEKSPFVQLLGDVKEVGNKETYENKTLGVKSYQYTSQVDFIQLIKLDQKKEVTIKGNISFMLCNDQECIPTTTQKFSLQIL